jgi:hypothetical protein
MAQYGHEVYGQFETLMAVGGDIADRLEGLFIITTQL